MSIPLLGVTSLMLYLHQFPWTFQWPLYMVFGLCLLIIYFNRSSLKRESILIAKDFGVQIERLRWDGTRSAQFFDMDRIRAFILHEHINPYSVQFFVAFIVRKEKEMRVVFDEFKLDLKTARRVYKFVNKNLNIN